jgi:hypothetical protein
LLVRVFIRWKGAFMEIFEETEGSWEHVYTQFKNPDGDRVLCMMHKETKKFVYFDVKLNRVLTKREALVFRADVTGLHVIYQDKA